MPSIQGGVGELSTGEPRGDPSERAPSCGRLCRQTAKGALLPLPGPMSVPVSVNFSASHASHASYFGWFFRLALPAAGAGSAGAPAAEKESRREREREGEKKGEREREEATEAGHGRCGDEEGRT
jgi:hypothetical protein